MLYITTRKWVLCTLLAGQNMFFAIFNEKFSPLLWFESGTSPVPRRYATNWAILAWISFCMFIIAYHGAISKVLYVKYWEWAISPPISKHVGEVCLVHAYVSSIKSLRKSTQNPQSPNPYPQLPSMLRILLWHPIFTHCQPNPPQPLQLYLAPEYVRF